MSVRFDEWVLKHRIGPGMNDDLKETREFLQSLLEAPEDSYLAHYRDNARSQIRLLEKGLYSGFDGTVGDGWVPILDRLAEDLIRMGWDRDLHQVKEKFGALRFNIGNGTEEMDRRINQAEEECDRICEECGAPGTLRQWGWWKTLCDVHQAEREKGRVR